MNKNGGKIVHTDDLAGFSAGGFSGGGWAFFTGLSGIEGRWGFSAVGLGGSAFAGLGGSEGFDTTDGGRSGWTEEGYRC